MFQAVLTALLTTYQKQEPWVLQASVYLGSGELVQRLRHTINVLHAIVPSVTDVELLPDTHDVMEVLMTLASLMHVNNVSIDATMQLFPCTSS